MFGLSIGTTIGLALYFILLILSIIYAVSGTWEGKKVEEEYEVDEWYRVL